MSDEVEEWANTAIEWLPVIIQVHSVNKEERKFLFERFDGRKWHQADRLHMGDLNWVINLFSMLADLKPMVFRPLNGTEMDAELLLYEDNSQDMEAVMEQDNVIKSFTTYKEDDPVEVAVKQMLDWAKEDGKSYMKARIAEKLLSIMDKPEDFVCGVFGIDKEKLAEGELSVASEDKK